MRSNSKSIVAIVSLLVLSGSIFSIGQSMGWWKREAPVPRPEAVAWAGRGESKSSHPSLAQQRFEHYKNYKVKQRRNMDRAERIKDEYDGYRLPDPPLYAAVREGNMEGLKKHLEQKEDPNQINHDTWPVLLLAASKGNAEMVRSLLKAGANVNAVGPGNWTALMLAAGSNHLEAAKALVDAGARVHVSNDWRKSPAMIARERHFHEMEGYLKQVGRGQGNATALIRAVNKTVYLHENWVWDVEGVKRCLEVEKVDVNAVDINGQSALHHLAERLIDPTGATVEATRILHQHKADFNLQDDEGNTPLHLMFHDHRKAYQGNSIPTDPARVKMMVQLGSRLDIPNKNGMTAKKMIAEWLTPENRAAVEAVLREVGSK